MKRLRAHPLFASALALCAVLALGEGLGLAFEMQAATRALGRLEAKRREVRALAGLEPAPTSDNAARVEADLATARQSVAILRAALQGRGEATRQLTAAPVPEKPADAYFELAAFVERMRDRATQAGVILRPEEHFGFGDYANQGPEPALIAAVHQERVVAEYLLGALFEAGPRRLLGLQREAPAVAAATVATAGGSNDLFAIDPAITARRPGFVRATAFRLRFTGQTATLRTLLNRLSTFELPLVVRSVEVERARADETAPADGAALPLVPAAVSQFTVTAEWIELEPPAPTT